MEGLLDDGELRAEGAGVPGVAGGEETPAGGRERLLVDGYCVIPDLLNDAVEALDRDVQALTRKSFGDDSL